MLLVDAELDLGPATLLLLVLLLEWVAAGHELGEERIELEVEPQLVATGHPLIGDVINLADHVDPRRLLGGDLGDLAARQIEQQVLVRRRAETAQRITQERMQIAHAPRRRNPPRDLAAAPLLQ